MGSVKGSVKGGAGALWAERLLWPPVLAAVIGGACVLTRKGAFEPDLPTPVVALLVVIFAGASVAYLTLHKRGERGAAWAAAMLGDGAALVFVMGSFGLNVIVGWAGAAITVAGLFSAIAHLTPKPAKRFAQTSSDIFPDTLAKSEVKTIMQTMIFPAALLEVNAESGDEKIVAANDTFAAVLGRVADKLSGVKFADLIPPDIEDQPMKFADAEWTSHRTSRGKQTMFMLSPILKPAETEPLRDTSFGDCVITDAETGLYTSFYLKYKGESDVQLCRRYKRQMSVIVLHMDFEEKNLVTPSDDARKIAFMAFARMVLASVRKSDTPVRTAEEEITVLLPETPQKGAQIVVTRLLDNVRKLAKIEVPEVAGAHIREASFSFFGDELVGIDQLLKEVNSAKSRAMH